MTPTEKAWLAGFIDGDGCFTVNIQRHKNGNPPSFAISCQITNTNLPALEYIQSVYGGTLHRRTAPEGVNRKDVYLLHLTRHKGCERIIRDTLPYLRLKREVADLVLNFPTRHAKSLGFGRGSVHADSAIIETQLAFYKQIQQLNKRGK